MKTGVMKMQAKNVLYAAVGAPVVAARKMSEQMSTIRGRMSKETANYTETATKVIDDWAAEGEKVVSRLGDGKVVEEISSKVDLDQAKEQVGKLRDQLEDMLATWRSSFRPEKAESVATAPVAKTTAATKKPAAKKPAAKTTTSSAKKPAAKKPAAKKPAAKATTSSAKKPAAKKSTAKPAASKAKAS